MLSKRVLSAIIFVPPLLAAIWFGEPWLSLVVAIAVILASIEFYKLVAQGGAQPFTIFGTVFALLFILNAHYSKNTQTTPLLVSATLILSLIWLLWHSGKNSFSDWAWTLSGIFYIGWSLSHFVLLRGLEQGGEWTLFAILATFATDTTALFVGRAWGKHQMTPKISPGKTWEGAFGGTLGSIAVSVILALILKLPLGYSEAALLGFLIAVFAQIGDLTESLLKRSVGAKDSGKLIPGHGGILDRLDSIIFTIILVYYYVLWLKG